MRSGYVLYFSARRLLSFRGGDESHLNRLGSKLGLIPPDWRESTPVEIRPLCCSSESDESRFVEAGTTVRALRSVGSPIPLGVGRMSHGRLLALSFLWLLILPLAQAENGTNQTNQSYLSNLLDSNLLNEFSDTIGADAIYNMTNDAKDSGALFIVANTGVSYETASWLVLIGMFLLLGCVLPGAIVGVGFAIIGFLFCKGFGLDESLSNLIVLLAGILGAIIGLWKWGSKKLFRKLRLVALVALLAIIAYLFLSYLGWIPF